MKKIIVFVLVLLVIVSCTSTHRDVLGTQNSQLMTRNYQSRYFDTSDRTMILRSLVSTMQDLGFIIEKADEKLGIISGRSFTHNSELTASVRKMGEKQMVVRINAQAGLKEISDPMPYQNFFDALSKSLFLEAHTVE
jgi:uncharacterized membrane protein YciS (DUF1049 family)